MKTRLTNLFIGLGLIAIALAASIRLSTAAPANVGSIYNLWAFPLQQITGSPGPGSVVAPTFAATVTLDPTQGIVEQLKGVSTTSATCTVNAASGGMGFGEFLVTICTADATGVVTYTFGTNFLPTATVAPTAGKSITVFWVTDGTSFHEVARSASAQ